MFFNVLAINCDDIPGAITGLTSTIYTIIKIAVPLLLIIFGMLDLGKAVISQKEDDIKKQQNVFVKRLIVAALVFFVFAIVQLLVNLITDPEESNTIGACMSKFLGTGW